MSKNSQYWSKTIETEGGTVKLSSHKTADGSTTDIEEGPDYYRSQHNNETNDRNVCVHDHNSDKSETKTWYDKEGNLLKQEHYKK